MSFTDVVYGGLGQVNNQFQANLGQNAAMNQNQQASMAAQQAAAAAQQAQLNNLYGPQGFGGQTAQYAAAGAAYGRNTGYYGDTSGLPPGQAPLPGSGGGIPSGDVWRGQDLPDISKPWVNPVGSWEAGYGERNPDVLAAARASGGDINAYLQNHLANFGMNEGRQVFDSAKYYQDNPDVAAAGANAWDHYNNFGRNEGRQADWGNVFNPSTYLAANPDVAASGINPLQHWLEFGVKEGRQGGGFAEGTPYNDFGLNGTFSSATGNVGQSPGMAPGMGGFDNPPVPQNPMSQYANGGYDPYNPATYAPSASAGGGNPMMLGTGSGGYNPQWGGSSSYSQGAQAVPSDWNNWFGQFQSTTGGGPNDYTSGNSWEKEYLLGNPDVFNAAKASNLDPVTFADQHYRDYGQNEGRRVFDPNEYLRENPDVAAAGVNAFQHYNQYGRAEGRFEPMSGVFDPANYLAYNPDVAAAGVDPTAHWFQYGQNEGRSGGFNMSAPTSGSTDFSGQSRPPADPWQSAVPKGRDVPGLYDALHAAAGLAASNPNAYAALIQQESTFNPREGTAGTNYGMGQIARGDFDTSGGRINGQTFDEYMNSSPADQMRTHATFIGNALRQNGINMQAYDDRTQYALLQAMNFSPWNQSRWLPAFLAGDTSIPTTPSKQGSLGYPSIADLQRNYDRISNGWAKAKQ